MTFVAALGIALFLAVLLSAVSARSPLSTSTICLAIGLIAGPVGLGLLDLSVPVVHRVADVALFTVLFTDGQESSANTLRRTWKLPARALLLGMPLTFGVVTLLAYFVAGVPLSGALILGAVLAPTDPVFAAALVGREDVPRSLRRLLNVESGLNDGLALPAVVLLIGAAGGQLSHESTGVLPVLGDVALGVLFGIAFPLAVAALLRIPALGAEARLQPLGPLSVAILLYVTCDATGANSYLAAFIAGITLRSTMPSASNSFSRSGVLLSELVKDAALLAFASLFTRGNLAGVGWEGWLFAAATLLIARPVPVLASLAGTGLPKAQRLVAGWFGPKGFASVVYALLVLDSGLSDADHLAVLVAACVLVSVVAHSSSDVPIAQALVRLTRSEEREEPDAETVQERETEETNPQADDSSPPAERSRAGAKT
jgi:NhaP-type Na+/H+ or K+/H+ antiporter